MKSPMDDAEYRLIRERAAEWACELNEGATPRHAQFAAWVKQSPRHIEEFLLAATAWKALDDVGPTDKDEVERAIARALAAAGAAATNVVELKDAHPAPALAVSTHGRKPSALQWTPRFKIAAGIAATAMLAATGWALSNLAHAPAFETAVGEQRAIRLTDGSVLYLNTHSRATVEFSSTARQVHLLSGEALFVVAHEAARPFRVVSATTVIQAVGTQFNVRLGSDSTQVSVIEGRVRIPASTAQKDSRAQLLGAGEEAIIRRNGQIVKRAAADVSDAVAWRERRLVFRGETLEDIAAEINRYGPKQRFVVEGADARQRRFAGTFSADDQDALVRFLRQYEDLSVERSADKVLVRLKDANASSPQ